MSFVVCCVLLFVRSLLHVIGCLLCWVCSSRVVVCCLLFVDFGVLFGERYLLIIVGSLLFVLFCSWVVDLRLCCCYLLLALCCLLLGV